MPTQFNTGFAGFSPGILRKRQVSGDNEWNPLPQNEGNNNYVFPTPIPSAGSSSTPRPTATPATTPRPTATPAGDNSNAGIVNPRLFRHDNTANRDFWEAPERSANRPHVAMDFPATPNASVAAGATVPQYPATASVFDEVPGYTYSVGEPTVQTPRMAGSSLNLDTAPSLFESAPTNPFDQWWRTPFDDVTGSASVAAGTTNTGGSIWEGSESIGDFGGDLALGNELNTSLGDLGLGENYPAIEAPATESPFTSIAEGTGIPIEPDPLNQDTGDLVWTTSPDDRRFLPGSEESTAPPPVPTRSLAGGPNLRDFGNNLSLGAFLNMPLSSMRYGEDYTWGGDVITPGGIDHTNPSGTPPLTADAGTPPPATGQLNIDPNTGRPYDLESIPEAEAVSPEVRRGQLVSGPNQQPGLTAILRQFPSLNNPASIRAISAGANPRDLIGRSQFDSRAANNMLMWSQSIFPTPNDPGTNSEEPRTLFPGQIGQLDEFGNYEQTGNISGLVNRETYRGFRYGSQRSTVRGIPAWSGSGGRGG